MSDLAEPPTATAIGGLPRDAETADLPGFSLGSPDFAPAGLQLAPALIQTFGREELRLRAENVRRALAEHGVTCFLNRPGGGGDEPWHLDLFPLVLGREEWQGLERGLRQRARLLNLVLRDLHGTQRLVRDGFVPATLVFANPGYLRACQALEVKDGNYLQIYAADLGRSPDGTWWVLADRTQAPSGLGFALENRSILWRVLPEALRALQPQPLMDPALLGRENLRPFAPPQAESPTIALLTPGPRNEAYFEHAYLSRLHGLTLVEGGDLTVRNRQLFMKTLDGLRRVDVVLRRVNDAFCDPLELRGDSTLGVPGLVEAARAGQVSILNALGAGLMESPAFMPFLPGLCRRILHEDLLLPSVPTWWCGQERELARVRADLEAVALRPAFNLWENPLRPAEASQAERGAMLEQLARRPHEFVAQEEIPLSRAPVWKGDSEPGTRPWVLRVFVVCVNGNFTVLPGGLARVLERERLASDSLALAGLSKDVWVLPEGGTPVPPAHHNTPSAPALEKAPSDLPSRTADNFFWLGRYAERLEQTVRTTRYVLRSVEAETYAPGDRRLGALLEVLAGLRLVATPPATAAPLEWLQKEILLLLFQEDRPGGLRQLLGRIHLAAFSVRDRFSADTWKILNRLEPDARQRPRRIPLTDAVAMLQILVLDLAAFNGMEMENMTRGYGWAFLDLGRRIERALFMAGLMEAVLRLGKSTPLMLEPALEIADSVMTHRRRYFSEPRLTTALEVLVQDAANPRSLAFQMDSLAAHAAALPPGVNPEGVAALRERIARLASGLKSLEPATQPDATVDQALVAKSLAALVGGLAELSELLTQVYFSHVTPQVS